MATKDSLGDRIKEFYENRAKHYLPRKVPVMMRLDGRSFHSFTKGFNRPYDEVFHNTMNATLLYLCKNIQGCKFGYTQSDEISLVLTDLDTSTTDGWFDYGVQKMCSVAASMATLEFNRQFIKAIGDWWNKPYAPMDDVNKPLYDAYLKAIERGAMFDARVFSIPEEEVCNYFIWRFLDCYRNSVQMMGQTYFSHKELHGCSSAVIQEMLFTKLGINYNDMPLEFKRGVACIRTTDGWMLDKEMPDPRKDRDYFERFIYVRNDS